MPGYYFIRSNLNNLYLDVEGSNKNAGAPVSPYEHNGTDAQQFYDCPATGTIRSKLNGFCLDIAGDRLVLNPYHAGKAEQQWERKGTAIVNRKDKQVIDIFESRKAARTKVLKYHATGNPNQSWAFEPTEHYYFIRSNMHGLYLDVEHGNKDAGALVSPYEYNGTDAQQFYDDAATGTIRSKLNGFCLDIEGGRLVLNPYTAGKVEQQWERKGTAIVNRHDKQVIDILESGREARRKVIKYQATGNPNQSWSFEPAAKPSTGAVKDVHYYFIKSNMHGFYLDVEDSIKTPGALVSPRSKNGNDAQIFYDDPATGTIRSKLNGFCLDIADGRLVLNPYQAGKEDQQWERKGNLIVNRRNNNMVLDIFDSHKEPRTKVIKFRATGNPNQSWAFEAFEEPRHYYFIKSNMHGLYLDVEDAIKTPGALISPRSKNGNDAQKFYDDAATGTIRSKLNGFCLDIGGNRLVLNPYQAGKELQQWERKGNLIVNRLNPTVLDIFNSQKEPRTKVIKFRPTGNPNQSWAFEATA